MHQLFRTRGDDEKGECDVIDERVDDGRQRSWRYSCRTRERGVSVVDVTEITVLAREETRGGRREK